MWLKKNTMGKRAGFFCVCKSEDRKVGLPSSCEMSFS